MKISESQKALIYQTIDILKNSFEMQSYDATAEPFYHLQADAICWGDEIPSDLSFEANRVVQFLLAARSQSYSDSCLTEAGMLDQLRGLAPSWAFLIEDRHERKWLHKLETLREVSMGTLESELSERSYSPE